MNKKRTWALIVGILFALTGLTMFGEDIAAAVCGIVIGVGLILLWYLPRKKAAEAKAEMLGREFKYKVTAVTHTNSDGSSRQDALKAIYDSGVPAKVDFEKLMIEGMSALNVLADGFCVGEIRYESVADINYLLENGKTASLKVGKFKNEESEIIYYASVLFQ